MEWQEELQFLIEQGVALYSWYAELTDNKEEKINKERLTQYIVDIAKGVMETKIINGVLTIVDSFPDGVRKAVLKYLARWSRGDILPGYQVMSSIREGDDVKDYWEIFDYLDGFYNLRVKTTSDHFYMFVAKEGE